MRAILFLLLLIFSATNCAFAQAGGATALPPNPDQLGTNQDTNGAFQAGNFTGYAGVDTCASVVTAPSPLPPSTTHAAQLSGCAGGSNEVFEFSMALHNHEAILVRWQGYASPGFLGTGMSASAFDNSHGNGSSLFGTGRSREELDAPSSIYTTNFLEYYPNIAEHGTDTNFQLRFNLNTPGWAANGTHSVGDEIVDTNGNIEQVTACSGTCKAGTTTPTWDTLQGNSTTDNLVTWTNEGANPPFYVTNIEVEEEWYPIRTFLLYPNYRGYLWNDLVPPKRFTQIQPVSAGSPFYNFLGAGSTPVAGEIMGVSKIDPPNGDTLSQLTLTVTLASAAGCATGVLATDTFAAPQSVQAWQFTPTQYGTLTVGNSYFVCSSLTLTTGGTLIDTYPDWQVVYENATFRSGLFNWYDPNNIWEHAGKPEMLIATYDRASGTNRTNGIPSTVSGWTTAAGGTVPWTAPQATTAGNTIASHQNGDMISDYCAQGFTGILSSFGSFSGISVPPGTDQLTPYITNTAGCGPNGLAHWQIMNNWKACLSNEEGSSSADCIAPTFSPTVFPGTGGTISGNFLFLEAAGWSAAGPAEQSARPSETLPSPPFMVDLAADACAGVNCSATITMPTCPTTRWLGWYLYAATNATSTAPANSSFERQYLSAPGMLGNGGFIPCGATVTLSGINSGPPPPTTDSTFGFRPIFASSTLTDPQVWGDLFTAMNNSSLAKGVGGMYFADEPAFYSIPLAWYMKQQLLSNNLNLPVACVLIGPANVQEWRDVCDLIGEDPYGYKVAPSPNEVATGESTTQNCQMYQTFNLLATQTECYRSRTDVYTDDWSRQTFGARPAWDLYQLFGNNSTYGAFPYLEVKTMIWKHIIDCESFGSLGCSAISWGWVDSTGLESQVMNDSDSQAWLDNNRAVHEVENLVPILETPVEDAPLLGTGTVVSGVAFSVTPAAACSVSSTSAYVTNTGAWPDAPANFVTHTDPATGDQYVFSNNMCSASAPFTATYGLVKPPAGATLVEVLNEGRTLPLSTTGCPAGATACFTDTWQQEDTHIYVIRAPRGMVVH